MAWKVDRGECGGVRLGEVCSGVSTRDGGSVGGLVEADADECPRERIGLLRCDSLLPRRMVWYVGLEGGDDHSDEDHWDRGVAGLEDWAMGGSLFRYDELLGDVLGGVLGGEDHMLLRSGPI